MQIFALSDPHLALSMDKPMSVFGSHWEYHAEKIEQNWKRLVMNEDLVLVPGDISWAMRVDEAQKDLDFLQNLPGTKVLIRGNHDYWWQSITKLRKRFAPIHLLQADTVEIGGAVIGGTRLWDVPGVSWSGHKSELPNERKTISGGRPEVDHEKIFKRELGRLDSVLGRMKNLPESIQIKICLLHYPPLDDRKRPTPITERLTRAEVDLCVFGHLHGPRPEGKPPIDFKFENVRYVCASADLIDFSPVYLGEIASQSTTA